MATVIIAAVVGIGALSQGGYSDAGGQVIMPTPGVPGLTRNGRVLGEAGAPVSIVEYADFQ